MVRLRRRMLRTRLGFRQAQGIGASWLPILADFIFAPVHKALAANRPTYRVAVGIVIVSENSVAHVLCHTCVIALISGAENAAVVCPACVEGGGYQGIELVLVQRPGLALAAARVRRRRQHGAATRLAPVGRLPFGGVPCRCMAPNVPGGRFRMCSCWQCHYSSLRPAACPSRCARAACPAALIVRLAFRPPGGGAAGAGAGAAAWGACAIALFSKGEVAAKLALHFGREASRHLTTVEALSFRAAW